jgi:hypothetical protein
MLEDIFVTISYKYDLFLDMQAILRDSERIAFLSFSTLIAYKFLVTIVY